MDKSAPYTGTLTQRRRDGDTFDADIVMIEAGSAVMVLMHACAHAKTLLGHAKLSREVGEHPELFVAMPAQDLAYAVREHVRDHAETKHLALDLHCECDCVWVEPRTFSRALYELVENAVEASRRGAHVTIDAHEMSEGDALWQVHDIGRGMSEHGLAALGARTKMGFGRGVALAWAIIEKHGGLLRFESAPGVGTTATIWLPGCH